MNKDLGVWTADDCALVDRQPAAHRTGIERLAHAGGNEVGVAEAEKLAAAGQPAH